MLYRLVSQRRDAWLAAPDCPVRTLVTYIREQGRLRPPQIEAIETYLFLKLAGQNKPLWQLFAEGFFAVGVDLDAVPLPTATRTFLAANTSARALYAFARQLNGKQPLMPEVVRQIERDPTALDYAAIIRNMFYGVRYADYLFSLPMGAGKTFQMAAFIYLDLYLAQNEPNDPRFAHNFLILIPNGLKSSIAPSLRTIADFDPTWVIPEPAASQLQRLLRFEVLDQPKTGAKSNKARNPNSAKVNAVLADGNLMGQVFVVNAEKVILNKADVDPEQLPLFRKTEREEYDLANELRNRLGKIPNLALHIDEVHHAAQDDVQLRRVVNHWQEGGTVTNVLGYTGTPYLKTAETLSIAPGLAVKLTQITNTVYYYPLVEAVRTFLKKPVIREGKNLAPSDIIRRGVEEFRTTYGATTYPDGTTAKLALYCSSIERLETEVRPLLLALGVPPQEILAYHRGNKQYPISKEAERAFNLLDTRHSPYRYILLVGIGKEGWSCRSLTSVILSAAGDSPANAVLQTSCRCLRQVDGAPAATALVWLNESNAKILNKQLDDEQHTSIDELNRVGRGEATPDRIRQVSRADHLRLPRLHYQQLRVRFEELVEDAAPPDARLRVEAAPTAVAAHRRAAEVVQTHAIGAGAGGGSRLTEGDVQALADRLADTADALSFGGWLRLIAREGMGFPAVADLQPYAATLRPLFEQVTAANATVPDVRRPNLAYDQAAIRAAVRRAFHPLRRFQQHTETVPADAALLVVKGLREVAQSDLLYPQPDLMQEILHHDAHGTSGAEVDQKQLEADQAMLAMIEANPSTASLPMYRAMADEIRARLAQPAGATAPPAVRRKDRSLHYLPYDFGQSALERDFLHDALKLADLDTLGLEIYYNGAAHLTGFRIECYKELAAGRWRRVGLYTPDFLVIQRRPPGAAPVASSADDPIYRLLIVETKGEGYAQQPEFKDRWQFTTDHFVPLNNQAAGYPRFETLLLTDGQAPADRLQTFSNHLQQFFGA